MPLNAEQLDAFWMVVQSGSFHGAAEALFITQPAVTQRIRALEATLGQTLFVRSGRGVVLTEAGKLLSRYCREQRHAETEFLSLLRGGDAGFTGRLAIAAGSFEGRTWLLPAIARIGREHPNLDITLRYDDAGHHAEWLESGQVEAVLGETPLQRRGLRSVQIGTVSYGLIVGAALADRWPEIPSVDHLATTRMIDFSPEDRLTLDMLASCLPGEDFSALRRQFVNDMPSVLDWVSAGGGYSALPLSLVSRHSSEGSLRQLYPEVVLGRSLYWSVPVGGTSPALELVRTTLHALLSGNR